MRSASTRFVRSFRRYSSSRLSFWSAILVSIVGFSVFFQPVVVQGKSMLPSLHDGEVLLMDRQHYRFHHVKPDDVVIFRHGRELYIKRVFATAGQTVWVVRTKEGITSLVETTEQRYYTERFLKRRPVMGRLETLRVPPRSVFVVGDNLNYSIDSRDFGPVPNREIVGYVPGRPLEPFTTDGRQSSPVQIATR